MKIIFLMSFILFGLVMIPSLVAESPKIGKITWDEDIFHKGSDFFAKKIQVIDSDMNQNQSYFLSTTTPIANLYLQVYLY